MGLAVGVCCVCRWAVAASMIKTAEQRFVASTAPDGSRWAPNSPATIMHYLRAKGGAFNKRGGLTKRGGAAGGKQETADWRAVMRSAPHSGQQTPSGQRLASK